MFRFRRVNIDGKSITESYLAAADVQPGAPVVIANGKFTPATKGEGRLYVAMPAYHQGKGIGDKIAKDEMMVADYMEEGREFAIRLPAGAYVKDAAITIDATGFRLVNAEAETPEIAVAYCQENVTLEEVDFIRVRIA
ncbi:TPA: hypothetical protein ACUSZX_002908 [Escherichia coli]